VNNQRHYFTITLTLYADEQDGSPYETAETGDRLVRELLDNLAYDVKEYKVEAWGEVDE
jgi:hypothetical protein